jgi:amino acid transporter
LAQSFDRFLPARIAYVSPRTGAPIIAQAIVLVLTISLVGAVAFLYGSLQALFAGVIAAMIYFVFIGVTAVLHGWRKEQGRVRGALVLCGVLMAVVFAYITYQFLASPTIWGTGTMFGSVPGYYYAYLYVVASFVAGVAIYFASKSYYAKKGLDISWAFKEIPPE